MRQPATAVVARQAAEAVAFWSSRGSRGRCVVAFWCNAGEHRSVAAAEAYARAQGGRALHLCAEQWHYRGCGMCPECDPDVPNPRRQAAWDEFRRIMEAGR